MSQYQKLVDTCPDHVKEQLSRTKFYIIRKIYIYIYSFGIKCKLGVGKNRTKPSQTEPTEPKLIQTEPKSISNHSVEYFFNSNGSVRFKTEPNRKTDVFL